MPRSPNRLNNDPAWSDERGLNAMQMLAMIASSMGAEDMTPANLNRSVILDKAWANLTASRYLQNIVNLKIEDPVDVNFSDDELAFLPYFTWLVAAQKTNVTKSAQGIPALLTSIHRSHQFLKRGKGDLWCVADAVGSAACCGTGHSLCVCVCCFWRVSCL